MVFFEVNDNKENNNKIGKTAKEKFPKDFVEKNMRTVEKEYIHIEEVGEEDAVEGEMCSFDRMVHLEGGSQNPANVVAAMERCRECIKQGPRYFEVDGWSTRANFMKVKKTMKDHRKNTWAKKDHWCRSITNCISR